VLAADQLQIILKELLETAHSASDLQIASQAKNFYQSCINETLIEQEGEVPLLEVLAELGKTAATLLLPIIVKGIV
jgi:hypothetical protein